MHASASFRDLARRAAEPGLIAYGVLMALAAAAATAKNLAFAAVLTAQGFGVYTLAAVITAVGNYAATAGVMDGLFREVPILRGAGDTALVERTRSAGLSLCLTLGAVCGALVAAACYAAEWSDPSLTGLRWAGPLLGATVALNVLLLDLRARERSTEFSAMLLAKSGLAVALVMVLAPRLGAAGAIAAETLALAGCAAWCWWRWMGSVRWTWSEREIVMRLMKRGLPFTGSSVLQNLAMTADRWAVQLRFGTEAAGRYAFVMLISTFGLMALNIVQQYATPRILRAYGATRDAAAVFRKALLMLVVLAAAFALAAVPAIGGFSWVMARWYPQYQGAESLIVPVYAGTVFVTLGFFDVLFFARGDGRPLAALHGAVLAAQVLGYVLAAATDAPLVVYAMIFAAGRLLSFTLGWALGRRAIAGASEALS